MRRFLKRLWLRVRFVLFQRQRHDRLVLEHVAGYPLVVLPQVFNPALFETSEFFARSLQADLIPIGSTVLDMGTGSGLVAIAAVRWAGEVIAIDVNPEAVRCAQINVLLNHVDARVKVVAGDLFAPIGDRRFDVILFNPPYFRGTPRTALDRAFRAEDVIERFTAGLRDHLSSQGYALIVLSSDSDTDSFLSAFRSNGFSIEEIAQRDLTSEALTIYRLH